MLECKIAEVGGGNYRVPKGVVAVKATEKPPNKPKVPTTTNSDANAVLSRAVQGGEKGGKGGGKGGDKRGQYDVHQPKFALTDHSIFCEKCDIKLGDKRTHRVVDLKHPHKEPCPEFSCGKLCKKGTKCPLAHLLVIPCIQQDPPTDQLHCWTCGQFGHRYQDCTNECEGMRVQKQKVVKAKAAKEAAAAAKKLEEETVVAQKVSGAGNGEGDK